jgi:hypothetical protein
MSAPVGDLWGWEMAVERWAQWATIIGLPLAAIATFASVEALHPHSTPTTPVSSISSSVAAGSSSSSQNVTAAVESHVPRPFVGTCRALAADLETAGLTAAIVCFPTGSNAPGSVQYYQYADAADMNTAFAHYAGSATTGGSCSDQADTRGTYHLNANGANIGSWACYVDTSNRSVMMWTNNNLNILSMALSITATPQQLYNWFFSPGIDPGPD